ncbi:hypothetical protein KV557_31330 [Kitasatospora aureofaciens]|uniref:hypothetical protein n=1 Tax=Kitasatospora aureofaciens TaxID=1894 RepID=UPI001C476498|nr:hypothetical protein [Kitasatospora aureofaciens]MBV6701554.1 hypothetical protein [Kitasatospora aureofaciens]
MTGSLVRPAGLPDADELLRLRVAVLDGAQLTDDWRATEAGAPLYHALGFDPVCGYMTLRPGPAGWQR